MKNVFRIVCLSICAFASYANAHTSDIVCDGKTKGQYSMAQGDEELEFKGKLYAPVSETQGHWTEFQDGQYYVNLFKPVDGKGLYLYTANKADSNTVIVALVGKNGKMMDDYALPTTCKLIDHKW